MRNDSEASERVGAPVATSKTDHQSIKFKTIKSDKTESQNDPLEEKEN